MEQKIWSNDGYDKYDKAFKETLKEENKKADFNEQQKILKLLQENTLIIKQNKKNLQKIKNYITFLKIFTVLKVLIVIIPIILGFIYLPPFIREVVEVWKNFVMKIK
jgi:hypothetical protein